jgi:hypothetical protein
LLIDKDEMSSMQILRSIGAVLTGIVVSVALSLATDLLLHKAGFFPRLGQPAGTEPLLVATAYRTHKTP